MVNITIYQSGDVTGDKGKIIAYEGQQYSDTITIVHPLFTGAEYFIEYKYSQTIYRDKLDANNRVKIKIEKAGYVKCQLLAIDILTGEILFKSKSWDMLVHNDFQLEPSHYPCDSYIHCAPLPPHHCNHDCHSNDKSIDSYEAYFKLLNELRNEEEIRHKEIQSIYEDIALIKNALNLNKPITSNIDANELIEENKYYGSMYSINIPEPNQEYVITVERHDNTILQYAAESDGDNIWFRSGIIDDDGSVVWTSWAPTITRVKEL